LSFRPHIANGACCCAFYAAARRRCIDDTTPLIHRFRSGIVRPSRPRRSLALRERCYPRISAMCLGIPTPVVASAGNLPRVPSESSARFPGFCYLTTGRRQCHRDECTARLTLMGREHCAPDYWRDSRLSASG